MPRQGRQRGLERVYDRALIDSKGKRRAEHAVDGPATADQPESGGLSALDWYSVVQEEEEPQFHPPLGTRSSEYYYSTTCQSPFRYRAVPYEWRYEAFVLEELQAPRPPPSSPAALFRGKASCKGSRKFKHNEMKMYYHDAADDVLDYDFDS